MLQEQAARPGVQSQRHDDALEQWCLRPLFQYLDAERRAVVGSDIRQVGTCNGASVIVSSGDVAAAAPSSSIVDLLIREGVVDHTLWDMPSPGSTLLADTLSVDQRQRFEEALQSEVAAIVEMEDNRPASARRLCLWRWRWVQRRRELREAELRGRRVPASGLQDRLTAGLAERHDTTGPLTLHLSEKGDHKPVLLFCAELPDSEAGQRLGLKFLINAILDLIHDALMKVHEGMRQHWPLSSRKAVAVFVYSYELDNQDEQYDQIYRVVNDAMRNRKVAVVDFFRPFIWELSRALADLPPVSRVVYRGINCRIDPHMYERDDIVIWGAFSSASQDKEVAREFAKGESGTLFLVTSTGSRPIEFLSKYPDEAEVLFAPDSVFRVTGALIADTELGSLYTHLDNIVMTQCGGPWSGVRPRDADVVSVRRSSTESLYQ